MYSRHIETTTKGYASPIQYVVGVNAGRNSDQRGEGGGFPYEYVMGFQKTREMSWLSEWLLIPRKFLAPFIWLIVHFSSEIGIMLLSCYSMFLW
jgi:hypothetical protein